MSLVHKNKNNKKVYRKLKKNFSLLKNKFIKAKIKNHVEHTIFFSEKVVKQLNNQHLLSVVF